MFAENSRSRVAGFLGALALAGLMARAGPARALDSNRAITQYIHEVWTTEHGLPQNTVSAIAQTRDGFLWLGTGFGLVRFDGMHFTILNSRTTPELKNDDIRSLLVDRYGSLYIGTHRGGLTRMREGKFESFQRDSHGLPDNLVNCLLEDHLGNIWAGTAAGLARLENDRFAAVPELAGQWVLSLHEDRAGTIWVGTTGGLFQLQVSKTSASRFAGWDTSVSAICEDRSGDLWLGTSKGLFRLHEGQRTVFTPREGLASEKIVSLTKDRKGQLWIGTWGGGISRYQDGQFESYGAAEGLSGDVVRSIFEDREGSLWIGTMNGGLNRFRDSLFANLSLAEGFPGRGLNAVYADSDDSLWVGSNAQGLIHFENGRSTSYSKKDGLPSDMINCIERTSDGALWIATDRGLARLENQKISLLNGKEGWPTRFVGVLFEDSAKNLWIASHLGLQCWRDGKLTAELKSLPPWIVNNILNIQQSADGAVWLGTVGGVVRFQDGQVTQYGSADGLVSDVVTALHPDGSDMWIGTEGGTLHLLRDGKLTVFHLEQKVLLQDISQIEDDGRGFFWLCSSQGILRLRKQQLLDVAAGRTGDFQVRLFDRLDGLRTTEMSGGAGEGACWTSDGTLWFASVNGLVSVNPRAVRPIMVPPPRIERILVDDREAQPAEGIEFPPGKGRLEIHYTATSLLTPQRTRFRYRLEGFDDEWVDAGTRRVAYYTHVGGGHYRFLVQAANVDGEWNLSTVPLDFAVLPHFYETGWFYAMCALGILIAGLAAHRLRVRILKARQAELALRVSERTQELQVEVEKHKRTGEQLLRAKDAAEEAARVKSTFLANMSHEIRTPMNGVLGMTELVLDSSLTPEQRGYLRMTKRSAESLLHIINDILDFSKIEAGKLDLETVAFSPRDAVDDVLKGLALGAREKGINLVSRISPELPELLLGDPVRLRQVLTNLVGNAVKFTEKGDVKVTVQIAEAKSVLPAHGGEANLPALPDRPSDYHLKFTVSDTGIGIPFDKRSMIFDAFTQADSSTTRRFGGTGLGLAIASQLVSLMGGRLQVESEVGVGSTFFFTARFGGAKAPLPGHAPVLPGPAKAGSPERTATECVNNPSSLRILLAEDNEVNQHLATRVLQKRGHSVIVCGTGQQALDALENHTFDVVLMDVQMPVMDGLAATAAIRQREKSTGAHLPIIALTAHAMKGDCERCLAAGMDAYVSKPLRVEELFAALASLPLQPRPARRPSAPAESASEDSPEPAPCFDQKLALERVEGDYELLRRMIRLFTQQSARICKELQQAISQRDSRVIERAAHKLKGSVISFGAQEAYDAAGWLEKIGRDGNLADADAAWQRLDSALRRLTPALEALVQETVPV